MGTAFPAALGAPSLPSCSAATCKRQKVVAGRHQCKSNFFRLPSPGGIFANQLPGWLRISMAANFAELKSRCVRCRSIRCDRLVSGVMVPV